MRSYPTYDALALDLDLYFFNKISVIGQIGKYLDDDSWFVITDDGYCHLFDKDGNLDDINKITVLREDFIRKDIKKIIIPDSITRIYAWVFSNCKNLISVTIPNSVKCIENHAFSMCNSLTNITIPNSVRSIEGGAFSGCSSLTSVIIQDPAPAIGAYVFEGCSSLTSMIMPKSIKYIERNAFWFCKNLKNLFFKGKTLKQVKAMKCYPWGIEDENVIKAEFG